MRLKRETATSTLDVQSSSFQFSIRPNTVFIYFLAHYHNDSRESHPFSLCNIAVISDPTPPKKKSIP